MIKSCGQFYIDDAMKGVLWEEAKGKLRALVAIQGSYVEDGVPVGRPKQKWEILEERIESFIRDIEDEGLQE